MAWTENKKFRIRFLKENAKSQDHVIEFEVAEAGRVEFYKTVEYFLAAIRTANGFVKDCITITGEQGSDLEIEVQIAGFHQAMMQVVNQYGNELSKNAVSFK